MNLGLRGRYIRDTEAEIKAAAREAKMQRG